MGYRATLSRKQKQKQKKQTNTKQTKQKKNKGRDVAQFLIDLNYTFPVSYIRGES